MIPEDGNVQDPDTVEQVHKRTFLVLGLEVHPITVDHVNLMNRCDGGKSIRRV